MTDCRNTQLTVQPQINFRFMQTAFRQSLAERFSCMTVQQLPQIIRVDLQLFRQFRQTDIFRIMQIQIMLKTL